MGREGKKAASTATVVVVILLWMIFFALHSLNAILSASELRRPIAEILFSPRIITEFALCIIPPFIFLLSVNHPCLKAPEGWGLLRGGRGKQKEKKSGRKDTPRQIMDDVFAALDKLSQSELNERYELAKNDPLTAVFAQALGEFTVIESEEEASEVQKRQYNITHCGFSAELPAQQDEVNYFIDTTAGAIDPPSLATRKRTKALVDSLSWEKETKKVSVGINSSGGLWLILHAKNRLLLRLEVFDDSAQHDPQDSLNSRGGACLRCDFFDNSPSLRGISDAEAVSVVRKLVAGSPSFWSRLTGSGAKA